MGESWKMTYELERSLPNRIAADSTCALQSRACMCLAFFVGLTAVRRDHKELVFARFGCGLERDWLPWMDHKWASTVVKRDYRQLERFSFLYRFTRS